MRQKVTISLDSEIAEKLRLQSIKKYGNSRSMSRLIEDLATGAAEMEQPNACSILGYRTEFSLMEEAAFKKAVEEVLTKIKGIKVFRDYLRVKNELITGAEWYFVLKEACELEVNTMADLINECPDCQFLSGPVPKYESAGKNFVEYAKMCTNIR